MKEQLKGKRIELISTTDPYTEHIFKDFDPVKMTAIPALNQSLPN